MNIFSAVEDLAGKPPIRPIDSAQERGFARPIATDQGSDAAGGQREGDIVHDCHVPVAGRRRYQSQAEQNS